ncbi:very short patch repair endonuclease [Acinetobacter sp. ANC 4641]|uniref:very short patch repair endonuclease n=1 Tax=Acinetobacter sp. ANC 4641 TaxID=2529847 RepID=UPI001038EB39|nr:DNA mismatch endonuclease Vsr [Acinetobacter sp. ANC 4641]TCB13258.1 DNA mismatch endonuclease Vsr [Acinetobacter sp. ANC 4641]
MMDIVDSATRSRMMAGIKSRNTKPELLIRSILHHRGFRFRLHVKDLPGKPDIVLPKYHTVIFIHGCFWHGHENCRLFKLPGTRSEFWQKKIETNRKNDSRSVGSLREKDWKVCVVWECRIRKEKKDLSQLADIISSFIKGSDSFLELGSS